MSVDPNADRPAVDEAGAPIDELMSASDEFVDLDTAAWDAAEEWIADNPELAGEPLRALGGDYPEYVPAVNRVDRILHVLLLCNLALIALVFVLPGGSGSENRQAPAQPRTAAATRDAADDPFLSPPRKIGDLPADRLWEAAVRAAGEGEYARAILLLEKYESQARMTDVERRLVYNQLAYYLVKDGRLEEAQAYERKSHQIMTRSYLPEDLLGSAHRAEQAGDQASMRSAYARFLLQQKQVPPSLRNHLAEAYLKLGDSYRVEAERAETRAEQEELERMREGGGPPK
jgi:hypothetical protein